MTSLLFAAACLLTATAVVPTPKDAAAVANIESYLARFHASSPLPGMSVVVVRDGRVLLARGYGVEVVGQAAPMTPRSSSGIGSLAKSFTALAVLQLADRGLLALEDPVVKHLPWFRTADERMSRRVTVRMLLSNTSGLPSLDAQWVGDLDTSDDAMERLARSLSRYRMQREPGTAFEYSNEGWVVLGLLVQQLSGERYADYLQRHLLDPLEMQRSTTQLARFEALGVLHGHTSGVRRFAPARPQYQAAAQPAGSMLHASADDLGHYLIALLDGGVYGGRRIVSEGALRALWTPVVSFPGPTVEQGGTGAPLHYALGWMVDEIDGRTVVHHAGGTRTMSSETFLEPATRTGVSILINADTLDPYRWSPLYAVANNVLHLANGRAPSSFGVPTREDPTRNDYELPAALVRRYEGSYLDPAGNRLDVDACDGRLYGTLLQGGLPSGVEVDFTSEAAVVLRNTSGSMRGVFSVSPEGRVSAFSLEGLGPGAYRRMAAPRGDWAWSRSSSGDVAFGLPAGWTAQWGTSGFEARPREGSGLLLSGGWAGGPAPIQDGEATHVETVAGRLWREQVWTEGPSQWMRLRTRAGAREFELLARAPEGQLAGLVRDGLNDVLRSLRLDHEAATAPALAHACPGADAPNVPR